MNSANLKTELELQEVKHQVPRLRGQTWLVRRPISWTKDGFFTIGKIRKSSNGEVRFVLNGDASVTTDDVKFILGAMNSLESPEYQL